MARIAHREASREKLGSPVFATGEAACANARGGCVCAQTNGRSFAHAWILAAVAFILGVFVFASLALPQQALAADEPQTDITLAQGVESANAPFSVSGMLPGDAETQGVEVDVSHKASVDVQFEVERVENRAGDAARLSDVLHLRVVDRVTGAIVLEGSASELVGKPVSVPVEGQGVSRLSWTVEASLPTQIGNEYQDTSCVVDLHWFVGEDEAGNLSPLAPTGDTTIWLTLLVVVALIAVLAAVAYAQSRRKLAEASHGAHVASSAGGFGGEAPDGRQPLDSQTKKRIAVSAFAALALVLAAAGVAIAMFWAHERLPENRFATGTVSIALEGSFDEANIEPGHTVIENFAVTNKGGADAYWRMSFENLQGPLADALDVTVIDDAGVQVYHGSAVDLDAGMAYAQGSRSLAPGQTATFTVQVHMSESAGNGYQGADVTFDVKVDAVQAKNNAGGEF